MAAEMIKASDVAKKALEVMERHGVAYILFFSDKTVVMDPDAEDVHEFPPTNQMEVYKLLIIRAPFTKMKDAVITIAKKPQKEPFASFKGL
jgi:hypothetical protein